MKKLFAIEVNGLDEKTAQLIVQTTVSKFRSFGYIKLHNNTGLDDTIHDIGVGLNQGYKELLSQNSGALPSIIENGEQNTLINNYLSSGEYHCTAFLENKHANTIHTGIVKYNEDEFLLFDFANNTVYSTQAFDELTSHISNLSEYDILPGRDISSSPIPSAPPAESDDEEVVADSSPSSSSSYSSSSSSDSLTPFQSEQSEIRGFEQREPSAPAVDDEVVHGNSSSVQDDEQKQNGEGESDQLVTTAKPSSSSSSHPKPVSSGNQQNGILSMFFPSLVCCGGPRQKGKPEEKQGMLQEQGQASPSK